MLEDIGHHVFEAEVVVYEEQVPPPVLLADGRVVGDHEVPLRSRSGPWQNECAHQDDRG